MERRGVDAGRVTIVDGGFREELSFELLVVPYDAMPPSPMPTVDPDEVKSNMHSPRGSPAKRAKRKTKQSKGV